MNGNSSWTIKDLGEAMRNAVLRHGEPHLTKERNNKILCNGFWRSGDKQNVCIWPDTASWKDIKTNEGGGCKKFAEHVFNLSLPEFMKKYGSPFSAPIKQIQQQPISNPVSLRSMNEIWIKIQKNNHTFSKRVDDFLEGRGFINPRSCISSGYAELTNELCDFFPSFHQIFLLNRMSEGAQILVPIRDISSDSVKNLFIRNIMPKNPDQKSRLLPEMGGWHDENNCPRAFGFPHLIPEFDHLILFEGMADYFSGEYLLNHNDKFLPLGVPSASFFPKWANLLVQRKYKGRITLVYQLDRQNGRLSTNAVGTKFGAEALKILRNHSCKAAFFNWPSFVEKIHLRASIQTIGDIADICQLQISHQISSSFLTDAFMETLHAKR